MKRLIMGLMMAFMFVSVGSAETTPEDILRAVDQMTPAQAHELQKKLVERQWDPVPGGFFERLAIRGSMNVQSLKDVDLSSLNLSSGNDLKLDVVAGSEVAILWQGFNEKFRAGFKFSRLYAEDSDISNAGYSRVEMTQNTAALVANYQLLRADKFLWWSEAALGGGRIDMDVLDTPAGSPSTLSKYDKSYGIGELTTGIDWRFNSELSLNVYVGYQFSKEIELDQADRATNITIDPSGVKGGFGLSYNF